jgi:hypothetical protein
MAIRWIGLNTSPKTRHATRIPIRANAPRRVNAMYFSAIRSLIKRGRAPLPSRGGRGRRLKTRRIRFNVNMTLRIDAKWDGIPSAIAVATCPKVIDSGG